MTKGGFIEDFELNWNSKITKVDRITLPFQKIEDIALTRSNIGTLRQFNDRDEKTEWKNKLIWGDNKYVIASLLPEFAGKVKLIYIDPPFFTGTDMSMKIEIGDQETVKEPSAIEQIAYRNMWKEGPSSFFQYMYERLVLMKDLLDEDGTIWVRFDYHYSHYIKTILDEVFKDGFVNDIIIGKKRDTAGSENKLETATESLFLYSKSGKYKLNKIPVKRPLADIKWTSFLMAEERNPRERVFLGLTITPPKGQHFSLIQEKVDKLLKENYLRLKCKNCHSLFYYGESEVTFNKKMKSKEDKFKFYDIHSGTDFYVVQKLDTCLKCNSKEFNVEYLGSEDVVPSNNWLDIRSYASKTGYPTENSEDLLTRVIGMASREGDIVADFFGGSGTTAAVAERLNRKWITCDIGRFSVHTIRKRLLDTPNCKPFEILNLGRYERKYWMDKIYGTAYQDYIDFIVKLYGAKSFTNPIIHGVLSKHAVHVGPIDYSVTASEIEEAAKEAQKLGFDNIDILGWDWEMGIYDNILAEIKKKYDTNLILKWIPREVMDKRAVEAGDIDFYQLALLETEIKKQGDKIKVVLKDFILPNPELIPDEVRQKIRKWSDYIDYWSIDWNYDGKIFRNEWQDFRTKNKSDLAVESISHVFDKKKKSIAIKVIDIFGNDTTKIENGGAR